MILESLNVDVHDSFIYFFLFLFSSISYILCIINMYLVFFQFFFELNPRLCRLNHLSIDY